MGLDRDELAARQLSDALYEVFSWIPNPALPEDRERVAKAIASALLARLRPATVAPAATDLYDRPEWVRITGPVNAKYVTIGKTYRVVGWHSEAGGGPIIRSDRDDPWYCYAKDEVDDCSPSWEPCAAPTPSAASPAAGLDAPAVDREGFNALLDAVRWVLNDAAFKAPEQIGEVADRWVSRLERAIDSLPPSLVGVVK